jgi:hypothetical protein
MILQQINQKIHEKILYDKLKKVVLDRSLNEGFLKEFLKAKLYVKAKSQNGNLTFEVVNGGFLAFTSSDCLNRAGQNLKDYLVIETRSLLKSVSGGHSLILNSGGNYGKIFLYNEIQDILNAKIPESATRRFEIKEETKALIGQPKEYPVALVESITEYLSRDGSVEKAYLAWVKLEKEKLAHAMIGLKLIECSLKKYNEIVPKLGEIAQGIIKKGEYVDFIEITQNSSGVTQYMVEKVKPFYEQKRDLKV